MSLSRGNRLARAIAGAAMSGMTQGEIVELTGYPADRVLRICQGAGLFAGVSGWPSLLRREPSAGQVVFGTN
jgi:hypothetical protein